MASFNKIIIVGYLGRDPEIRYTPQGQAVCNFSVATTEKRKDRNGEMEDLTTWFRVTLWGRQAEVANQYLSKGKQVFIEGRVRLNTFVTREGVERSNLEVTATDIQFLSPRDDDGGGYQGRSSQTSGSAPNSNAPMGGDDFDPNGGDNDIPF